jgi:3-oxoadipate enol-lactonase
MWRPQVEALEAAGHRTDAPDLPGYGDAALEPGVVDYVGFAAARLEAPAAVVGCSFGGRVALELASARPELVERLVLVAPGLGGLEWSEAAQALFAEEEELLEAGDLRGAAAQQARMWLGSDAGDEVRALTEAMTLRSYEQQLPVEGEVHALWPEPPALSRLEQLDVPTLVVVGSDDLDDVRAMCALLVERLPDARLETVARAGHLPGLERPDDLNAPLLDFLR